MKNDTTSAPNDVYPRIRKTATLSECGTYRYDLTRSWGDGPWVTFVMLNPSTADAETDDPTIRRCMGFARSWGYDGIHVVNLFGFRAADPKALRAAADPLGPENNHYVKAAIERSDLVVVGWGAWYGTHAIDLPARINLSWFTERAGVPLRCLGKTKAGAPRHPLYVRADQPLEPWPSEAVTS